eukprot:TRINITY_DN115_c1_g1_i1.p1 TRINITY_DN115_c1_g1~~TRINITY_DN115_c1_g1_i1.p1  ORF type:complete len:101 (+),score=9.36 TRINITY_DN115_c1_g1_i1:1052-1354(+)
MFLRQFKEQEEPNNTDSEEEQTSSNSEESESEEIQQSGKKTTGNKRKRTYTSQLPGTCMAITQAGNRCKTAAAKKHNDFPRKRVCWRHTNCQRLAKKSKS